LFIADSGVLVNRTNRQPRKTFEPLRLKASPDHAAVHAMGRTVDGRGQRTAKVNHQISEAGRRGATPERNTWHRFQSSLRDETAYRHRIHGMNPVATVKASLRDASICLTPKKPGRRV
jgi:hypothetical protein